MTEDDVKATMAVTGRKVSMDAPFVQGEDNTLLDVMEDGDSPEPDKKLIRESLRKEIERAFLTLPQREADVLRLYYGIGIDNNHSLEEIGLKFGLTRERVRQIKEKAIRRLRQKSKSKALKAYLG